MEMAQGPEYPKDPTEPPTPEEVLRVEMRLVLDNHDGIAVWPRDWEDRGSYEYLYRKGEFLVADRDLERVRKLVPDAHPDPERPLFDGLTLLRGDVDVIATLDKVEPVLGPGVL